MQNGPNLASVRGDLRNAKFTIEKVEGDKASVKTEVEGQKPETDEVVKVEGKWVPKALVDAWPGTIAEAKAIVGRIQIDPAQLVQFGMMKGLFEPVLDGLLAANSQDDFNAQIDAAMKAVAGGPGAPAGP